MVEYKVALVGLPGVGKSTICIQFIFNRFVEEYDPTLEESFRRYVTIDDDTCLLDISESVDITSITKPPTWKNTDGIILVYTITSRSSFEEVKHIKDELVRTYEEDRKVPTIFVGNKSDLEEERSVTTFEGQEIARFYSSLFCECSAKDRNDVEDIFYSLVQEIRRKNGDCHTKKIKKKKNVCSLM